MCVLKILAAHLLKIADLEDWPKCHLRLVLCWRGSDLPGRLEALSIPTPPVTKKSPDRYRPAAPKVRFMEVIQHVGFLSVGLLRTCNVGISFKCTMYALKTNKQNPQGSLFHRAAVFPKSSLADPPGTRAQLCSTGLWQHAPGKPLLSSHQNGSSYNPDLFIIFISTLYSLQYREGAQTMFVNKRMDGVSVAGFTL